MDELTASRRESDGLRMLVDAARVFSESTGDYQALIGQVVQQASAFAGAYCGMALVSARGDELQLTAQYAGDASVAERVSVLRQGASLRLDGDSTVTQAVRSGKAQVVVDASSEAYRSSQPTLVAQVLRAAGTQTLVALPLRSRGRPIGVLHLMRTGPDAPPFTPEETELLQALADQAAGAIENARLVAAEEVRAERAARIGAAARTFAERHLAIDELYDAVTHEAATLIGNYAVLALVDESGNVEGTKGEASDPRLQALLAKISDPTQNRFHEPDSIVANTVRTGLPFVMWDARRPEELAKLSPSARAFVAEFDVRAFASVPLRVRGAVVGAIASGLTGHDARPLEQADVDLLQTLADHAGLAVTNAQLLAHVNEELEVITRTRGALERSESDLRASRDRLTKTLIATQRFAQATTDYTSLLDVITRQAAELLGAFASILLPTADGTSLEIRAQASMSPAAVGPRTVGAKMPLTETAVPVVRVYRENAPLLLPDLRASGEARSLPTALREHLEKRGINDFAGAPIRAGGKVIGALFVQQVAWTKERQLTEADLEVLQMLADQAGLALANANLLDDVRLELAEHKRTREALTKSEDNLRQAQRMEAVGRLAGGVAHDFNNMLSIVLSYADLILASLKEGDPMREDVKEIRDAGHRAAALTRQLLAFSRKQMLSPRVVDLNEVIKGVDKMLVRLLGEDVELKLLLDTPLDRCHVDPGQMEQVILNLVVNARDAMRNGGLLTLETGNVFLDEAYVQAHPEAAVGPHVVLSVTDTGSGMDRETLSRVFEPFFTTKPQGAGTGLGLATVYGIVKQSGGCIWVYSEPGQGTTFRIYLPRLAGDEPAVAPAAPPPPKALGGSETILVVEDEPQVRTLVRGILQRSGYHVLVAANGGEALLLCEQHGASIHLVLTDVVMPRMSGRQLVERLRQLRPKLKVVYMSGYTENAIVHHGVLDSDVEFVQKPLTPQSLLAKLRTVLDTP